ncbi:hypothetical protein BEWA_024500 [Theileria equi strain WA]|uniref:t-SNARE coiled-coil homology domain-containing protein n=1 Tax=Theileria equi strain WA TaxID=1537102 RepID=L0AX51_THEEQ|nr:hypothetical protein BEWA_024500 [Theileria equi strain WA]AFZ79601.1 hypothetical protein BEWA_024500 [Theileria equi strain WA]|eukprot:XP_004829267.1 hypothetical protein BEWA_024500 [Theileria equi strain WA]
MEKRYGRSTLGAMAARNTKTANIAKRAIANFKTGVINLTKQIPEEGKISNIQHQKQLKEVEKLQNEASNILGSLYDYSEEIKEKNESFILYDNLLDEFKEYMGKLDDLHNKLVNGQKSPVHTVSEVKHDIHVIEADGFQLLEEEIVQNTVEYPLESSILDERSEQIQALRSSVYEIQDLYIEIGDMVEYQGDQIGE